MKTLHWREEIMPSEMEVAPPDLCRGYQQDGNIYINLLELRAHYEKSCAVNSWTLLTRNREAKNANGHSGRRWLSSSANSPCQGSNSVKACREIHNVKSWILQRITSSGFHDVDTEPGGDVGRDEDVSGAWAKEQGDGRQSWIPLQAPPIRWNWFEVDSESLLWSPGRALPQPPHVPPPDYNEAITGR